MPSFQHGKCSTYQYPAQEDLEEVAFQVLKKLNH